MPRYEITSPDGGKYEINAPDGASEQDVMSYAQSQFEAPEPSFGERVSADFDKRNLQAQDIQRAADSGQQGALQTGLQVVGLGAGKVNDVIGEGMVSAGQAIAGVTPEFIKQPIAQGAQAAIQSDIGQSALEGIGYVADKYGQLKQEYPNAMRSVEAAGNILGAVPIGKAVSSGTNAAGEALQKAGKSTVKSSIKRSAQAKEDYLYNIIKPKDTAAVAKADAPRNVAKGIFQTIEPVKTDSELKAIAAIEKLPVKKGNTHTKNFNIVDSAIGREANKLKAKLAPRATVLPDEDIANAFEETRANLMRNPTIVGDGEASANKVINTAMDIINKNPKTASGLLESRKQLDQLIRAQRGAKAFNPTLDSPLFSALMETRQTINGMISKIAPEAGVLESLQKQSALFTARDGILTKAAGEGKTIGSRALQKGRDLVSLKGALVAAAVPSSVVSGLAGPAAAAYALYKAGKLATNPTAQRVLGKALEGTGYLLKGGKIVEAPIPTKAAAEKLRYPAMEAAKDKPRYTPPQRTDYRATIKNLAKDESGSVGGVSKDALEHLNDFRVKKGVTLPKNQSAVYRGVSETTGDNMAAYGQGLYVTPNKKFASEYGKLQEIPLDELPKNALRFDTINDFQIWAQQLAKKTTGSSSVNEAMRKQGDLGKWIQSIYPDIDGMQIGKPSMNNMEIVKWPTTNSSADIMAMKAPLTAGAVGAAAYGMGAGDAKAEKPLKITIRPDRKQ